MAAARDDLRAPLTDLAGSGDARVIDTLVDRLVDDGGRPGEVSQSAQSLAELGARILPAVAPLLNSDLASLRSQVLWIVRKIASDRIAQGVVVGWPAELHGLMTAYEVDMPNRERARLTRAVLSLLRERAVEIRV